MPQIKELYLRTDGKLFAVDVARQAIGEFYDTTWADLPEVLPECYDNCKFIIHNTTNFKTLVVSRADVQAIVDLCVRRAKANAKLAAAGITARQSAARTGGQR